MKKSITAKDIANLCGVSQATVSYVINDRPGQKISEETRKKILEAARELHYYPNASARNMRGKSSASIGIVCAKDFSRQAFLHSFMGISCYLEKLDYTITIFNEEEGGKSESGDAAQYVKSYFSNLIDGLIYISNQDHDAFTQPAAENHIPYVVICMDGVFSKDSPVPHAFDDVLAECAAFCRDRGLRQIRYFSIDNDGIFANHKYPVFQKCLETIYPECDLQHVVCLAKDRNFKEIAHFLEDYMADRTFDLAISQNYDIGLCLQREILKKSFQIPQQIKNLFLNSVNFYEMTYPSISGIHIPYREMGEYAARLILAVISGEDRLLPFQEFKCTLELRESTQ